jgi:hypothetical protein
MRQCKLMPHALRERWLAAARESIPQERNDQSDRCQVRQPCRRAAMWRGCSGPRCAPKFQRDFGRWNLRRVPERRIRDLGTRLPSVGHSGRLCGTSVIPVHWSRMTDAFCLGPGAPFLGESALAVYADVLMGLHDLRCDHCNLVPGRRAGDGVLELVDRLAQSEPGPH